MPIFFALVGFYDKVWCSYDWAAQHPGACVDDLYGIVATAKLKDVPAVDHSMSAREDKYKLWWLVSCGVVFMAVTNVYFKPKSAERFLEEVRKAFSADLHAAAAFVPRTNHYRALHDLTETYNASEAEQQAVITVDEHTPMLESRSRALSVQGRKSHAPTLGCCGRAVNRRYVCASVLLAVIVVVGIALAVVYLVGALTICGDWAWSKCVSDIN
eukprot:TRINITY_DN4907_c0_g1_i1.p1 TRINITY_DN4907_c0_g1~~TRINITY_DN4907_c0_g1_i1.p1  ORF type:complete len:214 (+),score=74.34 TRINITY_DN4907_c0_g1_i1:72-713(+)